MRTARQIERDMKKIRDKYNELGVEYITKPEYQSLIMEKNKLGKSDRQKEVRDAKIRDLIYKNNDSRRNGVSFQDLINTAMNTSGGSNE